MTIGYFATTTETDYSYTTTASTTVNPTLKDRNGNNFPAGKVALVYMFIEGTGTPDTDQLYAVGYAGSGASDVSTHLAGASAGVSNRPVLYKDTDNLIKIKTGHSSNYTIRVRVMRVP